MRAHATGGHQLVKSLALPLLLCSLIALGPSTARGQELRPPRPSEQPQARWPGEAATHDVVVPVLLDISASGEVIGIQIEASLGPSFDAAAREAALRWRFEPALRDGVPVEAKIRAVIRFLGEHQGEHVTSGKHPPDQLVERGHDEAPAPSSGVRVLGQREQPRSASEVVRDRAIIAAAPHRTANDALLVVPGVYITQHSGEGKAYQIFFRGFDAVHGQDLELWAGGAPVNDVSNLHGQGYADLHFLPPEVIKELRSTPGTYDPRQGDFAVAGTIRLELGYDEPGVTAKAAAGSFGSRRYFLGYRPKDGTDATFAAFEVYATDGFGPSRAARRTSAVAQTTYDLGEHVSARLMASTYAGRFDSAGVLRLDDIERGTIGRLDTYDPRQGGDSSRSQVVIEIEQNDPGARWSIAPYVVRRGLRLRSNFTGFLLSDAGDSVQQINDATTVGATGYYRRQVSLFSRRDLLEAGFSTRSDWIDQSQRRLAAGTDDVTATDVDAKVLANDVAGYLDAALYPHKRLMLRGGVRVDALSYRSEDKGGVAAGQARAAQGAHLGKKATAEGLLLPGLSAVVSYGEGFRSPQGRSLAEGQTTPFTTVRSYEAGLRYRDERLRGSAAVFRTDLSDDLVFDQATARNERVQATKREGLAVEYAAQPAPWFVSSASLTYTRATFKETAGDYRAGDLVPYVPQMVVRSDLAWTPHITELGGRGVTGRLGAGMTFLDARPLPYGLQGHDVFLLDLTASMRVGEVQLSLDVFNLLDAGWYDGEFVYASNFSQGSAPSLVPLRHVTVGAPRTVFGTLALTL